MVCPVQIAHMDLKLEWIRGQRRRHLIAILVLALGCPPALAATSGCRAQAIHAQESIPAERLANWEPVDDRTLLVWTMRDSRAHLVRLDRAIPGLGRASTIFLAAPDGERNICACGHDAVIVPGRGTARIASIQYLSQKRTAELDGATGRDLRTTFT